MHGTNEYPFLINQDGFSILPITSVGLTHMVTTDRISSVQYLKSPVGVEVLRSIGDGVRVFSDHPRYQASTTLTASQVMALAGDVS